MIKVAGLVFTDENIKHIARHTVSPREIKEVIQKKPEFFEAKLGRIMAIGPTRFGRMLAVILDKMAEEKYYVVTARDANRKEVREFNKFRGGESLN